MYSPNHFRTDSPSYHIPEAPIGRLKGCPDCDKYLPGDEWICAECLNARCSDQAEEMYALLKQITNPNRWGKELAGDIEAARTLCLQIEEGSR